MAEHWSFQNPLNMLPPGEPIPGRTYRADGWMYKDFPRMAPDIWDSALEAMGEGNWVALAMSDYGDSKRGQLLISPEGVPLLVAYFRSVAERLEQEERRAALKDSSK